MQAWLASLLVLAGGPALLWQTTDQGRALTAESARRLAAVSRGTPVSPFTLETMSGATARVPGQGKVAIVEFIYTSCPTICQSAGADMRQLADRVRAAGLSDRVALYSVSFDPGFDTVDKLADYGERHDADGALWTITRPQESVLPRLLDEFGIIVLPDRMGGYTHNVAVHVVGPDGRIGGIHDTGDFDGALDTAARLLR